MRLVLPVFLIGLLSLVQLPAAGPVAGGLQPFVEKHELAGAGTLVADKDKVLSLESIGFADLAAAKPMGPDTMFWIASESKAMTAVAVESAEVESSPTQCRISLTGASSNF